MLLNHSRLKMRIVATFKIDSSLHCVISLPTVSMQFCCDVSFKFSVYSVYFSALLHSSLLYFVDVSRMTTLLRKS